MARCCSCSNDNFRWDPDDRVATARPFAHDVSWGSGMALTESLCYCSIDDHHQCLDNLPDDWTAKVRPGVPWMNRMAKAQ